MNLQRLNPLNWFKRDHVAAVKPHAASGQPDAYTPNQQAVWPVAWQPLEELQCAFDRFFDKLFGTAHWPTTPPSALDSRQLATTDLTSRTDRYQLSLAVPGFDAGDLDVQVEGNTLLVSGRVQQESAHSLQLGQCISYRQAQFVRRFPLPQDVDTGAISAHFAQGNLQVILPRRATQAHRINRIPIIH